MNKILLVTRPNHDITTRYLFAWSRKIIELAQKKNIQVVDLKKEKANKDELESRISKMKPILIFFNGHGNSNYITGHGGEVLVKVNDNENILKSKIIYALSCRSAARLGSKSVKVGALTYLGYVGDFMFCYDIHKIAHPLYDKIAKLFLEPSNQICISLIKGNTSERSSNNSKKFFFRNMQTLLNSEASSESAQYAKFLWWDMRNLVCLGKQGSSFKTELAILTRLKDTRQ